MTKKKTKKVKVQKKVLYLTVGASVLMCCLVGAIVALCINALGTNQYKIENRVSEIKKEKKKDENGIKTVGWLRVQGTNIDTPIINYETLEDIDNINKDDFLWSVNEQEKLYNRVNIQGHNILNLSTRPSVGLEYFTKFEDLMGFIYYDFVKENKYIQYTIDGKNYMYKVFAVYFEEKYNLDLYHEGNYEVNEIKDFIDLSEKTSFYDFDVDVKENDKLIALVTCSRFYGVNDKRQFVVVGRMLRDGEEL